MIPTELITNVLTYTADTIYTLNTIDFFYQLNKNRRADKYWVREKGDDGKDIGLKELQKRYDRAGLDIPKIATVIPARNESDVIRSTIRSVSEINYPLDKMDLTIVTDLKEDLKDIDKCLRTYDENAKERKTTLEIALEASKEIYQEKGFKVKVLSIPSDYNGYDENTGMFVESKKGRALNHALQYIPNDVEYQFTLDADANPDPDVLIGAAAIHLKEPKTPIIQGPILQIGNYNQIGRFSKIVSLYQSITHKKTYPLLLEESKPRIPFPGGTNWLMKLGMLKYIGGFDPDALCEDYEVGVRAWFETGYGGPFEEKAYAKFNPYPAIEQTPPTFKDYRIQRKRWRKGGLDVKDKFLNSDYPKEDKKQFAKWVRRNELTLDRMQIGAIMSPWPAAVLAIAGKLPDLSSPVFWALSAMNIPSVLYPIHLNKSFSPYINDEREMSSVEKASANVYSKLTGPIAPILEKSRVYKKLEGYVPPILEKANEYSNLALGVIPASSVLAWPWIQGSVEHAFKIGNGEWVKTPRTKTNNLESLKDERVTAQSFDEMLAKKGLKKDYVLDQLLIYSHDDPKKSKFYKDNIHKLRGDGLDG